jgi:hypothetical protein
MTLFLRKADGFVLFNANRGSFYSRFLAENATFVQLPQNALGLAPRKGDLGMLSPLSKAFH